LSLREYVKSARLVAGLYGAAIGIVAGVLLGVGLMLLIAKQPVQPVREVHHYPVFMENVMSER